MAPDSDYQGASIASGPGATATFVSGNILG
jgi:hypothetical protein